MIINCEKCNHQIDTNSLRIKTIWGWEKETPHDLVTKLKAATFSATTGVTDKGKEYATLFVSTVARETLLENMTASAEDNLGYRLKTYREAILPVLLTLDKKFDILGALSIPSAVPLAMTNLFCPVCIFVFVTVTNTPDLKEKLLSLGLENLLLEGMVNTVPGTKDWHGMVSEE